jgi:hypothetical protein
MTRALSGEMLARRLNDAFPGKAARFNDTDVWIEAEALLEVSRFLRETPDLDFQFLTAVTAKKTKIAERPTRTPPDAPPWLTTQLGSPPYHPASDSGRT